MRSIDPLILALETRYPGKDEPAQVLGLVPAYWRMIKGGYKPLIPRLRMLARYILIYGPLPPEPVAIAPECPCAGTKRKPKARARAAA